MGKFQSICLYLSGFVVPELGELFLENISSFSDMGISEKRRLFRIFSQISLGKKPYEDIFHNLEENGLILSLSDTLENQISGGIKIISPEAVELINELSADFEVIGISDYPSHWINPLQKELSRVNLPFNNIFMTDQMNLGNLGSDLIDWLKGRNESALDSWLWIDANPKRSMYALSVGINSVIYVDIRRLRRELIMRKMLPKE
jgi:hypothetical protein